MPTQQQESKKGCKKRGRDKARSEVYRARGMRIRNKIARLLSLRNTQPNNRRIDEALRRYLRPAETFMAARDGFRLYNQRNPHRQADAQDWL